MPAEARASLILEIVRRSEYLAGVEASTQATADLVAEQERYATLAPKAAAGRKAESDAAKTQAKALKEVEKAYLSALAPHEKTALKLEQVLELRFDDVEATSKQAVAAAHLSAKLEDQTRRFEANRGSQNKLSRSLAELLDEQTKAQTAAIAAGAALIKEGITAEKAAAAIAHLKRQEGDHRAELKRLETQLEQVTAAEKAQSKAQEDAAKHYKQNADQLDAVKNALEGLHLPGAQTVDSIKKLSESLTKMSKEGSAAQAEMLKAGIALGAVAAAAAVTVVGIAAVGTALVGVVSKSDEWNEELTALGLNLDRGATAAINRHAASIDAVGSVAKAAGVAIASTFGPAIEGGATRIVALGLAAIDAWNNLGSGEKVMKGLARFAATTLVDAFLLPVSAVQKLGEVIGEQEIADRIAKNLAIVREEQIVGVQKILGDAGVALFEPLIAASDRYIDKARELIGTQVEVNRRLRDTADHAAPAAKDAIAELEAQLDSYIDAAPDRYAELPTLIDPLAEQEAAIAADAAYEAVLERVIDREKKAAEQRIAIERSVAGAKINLLNSVATAAGTLSDLIGEHNTKAAQKAFIFQQSAAAASAIVNTSLGITSALAAPPPTPMAVKVANAIAVGVAGAAAVANILATTIGSVSTPSVSVATSASATAGPSGYTQSPTRTQTGPEGIDEGRGPPPVRHDPRSLPVTDAFYQAVAGARQLVLAPGDEAEVRRAGTLGRSAGDNGGSAAMETLTRAVLQLDATFERTMTAIMVQAHRASVAGPVGAR